MSETLTLLQTVVQKINQRNRWLQLYRKLQFFDLLPEPIGLGHVSYALMECIQSTAFALSALFVDYPPQITQDVWLSDGRVLEDQLPSYFSSFTTRQKLNGNHELCVPIQEAFTQAMVHPANNTVPDQWLSFLEAVNALLDRLLYLPYSFARRVEEIHSESRLGPESEVEEENSQTEETELFPFAHFKELGATSYLNQSDDASWFLYAYESQITNSWLTNPFNLPIEVHCFYSIVPDYETALYYSMDPGENDYSGIVYPSLEEQMRIHASTSLPPSASMIAPTIEGATWRELVATVQSRSEVQAFPTMTRQSTLKEELLRLISPPYSPSTYPTPPQGIRGKAYQPHCACFRFLD